MVYSTKLYGLFLVIVIYQKKQCTQNQTLSDFKPYRSIARCLAVQCYMLFFISYTGFKTVIFNSCNSIIACMAKRLVQKQEIFGKNKVSS